VSVLWAKRGWMSGGTFVPHQLFASGAQGAWYDPSDFSTLFQDSAGSTPVTAVEQPVRLMRDRSGRGNDATAPNDASRPVLRARYNLLTFSEQFDNASWTKTGTTVSANAAVAPDGTTTADKWQETAGGIGHVINQSISVVTGTQYTFSVYAKADENIYVGLFGLKNSVGKFFNLSTGAVGNNIGSAPASASIEALGNGWYRCSITDTETATTNRSFEIYSSKDGTNWDYSGTLDDGIYIWGAQLLTAADQTATGGAYQRIAAATSYDTSNPVWRPYLAFDGSDDSFSTSSIDFSGTDEMTVFAGVTKLSDATRGMLVELSASYGNPGTFGIELPTSAATATYGFASGGSVPAGSYAVASGFAAPITNVLTAIGDISADVTLLRLNGVAAATNSDNQGTGNYANAALFIGRRNNTSLQYNGRLYSAIILGRAATTAELTATEQWINGKTGAY
jgi:hypothetical protein